MSWLVMVVTRDSLGKGSRMQVRLATERLSVVILAVVTAASCSSLEYVFLTDNFQRGFSDV